MHFNRVRASVDRAEQGAQRAVKVAQALLFRIARRPVQVPQRVRKRRLLGNQQHRYGEKSEDPAHADNYRYETTRCGETATCVGEFTPR